MVNVLKCVSARVILNEKIILLHWTKLHVNIYQIHENYVCLYGHYFQKKRDTYMHIHGHIPEFFLTFIRVCVSVYQEYTMEIPWRRNRCVIIVLRYSMYVDVCLTYFNVCMYLLYLYSSIVCGWLYKMTCGIWRKKKKERTKRLNRKLQKKNNNT